MKTSFFFPLGLSMLMLGSQCSSSPVAAQGSSKRTAARSWVKLSASTNAKRYSVGQPIQVRLRATNVHNRGAYLQFTSGQRFDLRVFRKGTSESVYTWSASRMFIQSLGSLWLRPGQSQTFEDSIGDEMGQLQPGKYRLEANLSNSPRPIVAPPVSFEIVQAGVKLSARTDKTRYKKGEEVRVQMTATNSSSQAHTLRFESGLDADALISDEAGNPIWTYGANLRFIRALGDVKWNKGETKRYSMTWNGVPLPGETVPTTLVPGRYRVQGVLRSTPEILAPPVFIEITE